MRIRVWYFLVAMLFCQIAFASFNDDFENGLDNWAFMTGDGNTPTFTETAGNPGTAGEYYVFQGNGGLTLTSLAWSYAGLPPADYMFFCDIKFLSAGAWTKIGTRMTNLYAGNYYGVVVENARSDNWSIKVAGPTSSYEPTFDKSSLPAGVVFNQASGEFTDSFETGLAKWEYSYWTSASVSQVAGLNGLGMSYSVTTNNGAVWPNVNDWSGAGLADVNDYSFEADLKVLADSSVDFVNRLSGPFATDTLGVGIANGSSSAWSLTILGASDVTFTSANLPSGLTYNYAGFNKFKVITIGSQMTVYLNGSLLWQGAVTGAAAGRPGLHSGWNGSAIIDNVRICAEPFNDGWNRFGFDVKGTYMTIHLNDKELWSGSCFAQRATQGQIGIATSWTGNFAIDNVLVSPKPNDCNEIWSMGFGWQEDLNGDCQVDILDLEMQVQSWLDCTDPENPSCYSEPIVGNVSILNAPANFLYSPGDSLSVAATISKAKLGYNDVKFKLIDYYQNVVWENTVGQTITSLPATITTNVTLPKRGIFRLEASIPGRNSLGEVVLGAVSTVPAAASGSLSSPFGIAPILDEYHLGIAKKMGATWLRFHDMDLATYWPNVEPTKNVWQWRNEPVQLASSLGFKIMGSFEATPTWASNAPQSLKDAALLPSPDPTIWREAWGYQPVNLDDVESYVRATVRNYKNQIKHWEIWNEPHAFLFWASMPGNQAYRNQLFVDMSQRIYETAKEEDPTCTIIGGGGINIFWVDDIHDMNMKKLFQLGLLNYCDVFSVHGYAADNGTNPGSEAMASQMQIVRNCMQTYSTVQRPIWMTETSFPCESFFTDASLHTQTFTWDQMRTNTGEVVRGVVSTVSAGVDKFFWWRLRHWGYDFHQANKTESLVEYTKAPKATFYSYAAMVERLHDAQFSADVNLGTGIRCKVFYNGTTSTAVIWTVTAPSSAQISLTQQVQVYDIMGNAASVSQSVCPLQPEPHYIVVTGTSTQLVNLLKGGSVTGM